jgi:hypothetical protein
MIKAPTKTAARMPIDTATIVSIVSIVTAGDADAWKGASYLFITITIQSRTMNPNSISIGNYVIYFVLIHTFVSGMY